MNEVEPAHPLTVIKYAKAALSFSENSLQRLDQRYCKPSFPHTLDRKSKDKAWNCKVCKRSWRSRPRTNNCVGVPFTDWDGAKKNGFMRIAEQLRQNLQLKPEAVPVAHLNYAVLDPYYDLLFDPSAFETACAYLPPIAKASETLKTMSSLRELNLRPRPGTVPAGCYYVSSFSSGNVRWQLLYDLKDCIEGYEGEYITKTRLMKTYSLSETWMQELGPPNFTTQNPHNPKGAEMQLFHRERVEQFLAERSERYEEWLTGRHKRVAIAHKVAAKTKVAKQRRREQTRLCLSCDSACMGDMGFFCAIYPMGWLEDVPLVRFCPDYRPRRS